MTTTGSPITSWDAFVEATLNGFPIVAHTVTASVRRVGKTLSGIAFCDYLINRRDQDMGSNRTLKQPATSRRTDYLMTQNGDLTRQAQLLRGVVAAQDQEIQQLRLAVLQEAIPLMRQGLNFILNIAARDLPEGWEIVIRVEKGSACIAVCDPDGNARGLQPEGPTGFADAIFEVIKSAKESEKARGESAEKSLAPACAGATFPVDFVE